MSRQPRPQVTASVVKNMTRRLQRDPATPSGKYAVLERINKNFTYNVGYPGFSNAAMDEVFNKFLIPQMFATAAQDRQIRQIFQSWRNRGKI